MQIRHEDKTASGDQPTEIVRFASTETWHGIRWLRGHPISVVEPTRVSEASSGGPRQPARSYRKTERHSIWQRGAQERNLHGETCELIAQQNAKLLQMVLFNE